MKHNFQFKGNIMSINGNAWEVEYIADPSGALLVFVTMDAADADKDAIIVIQPDDPLFAAAMAAAVAVGDVTNAAEPVQPVEEVEQTEEAADDGAETVEAETPAEEAPEAAEPVQPVEEVEQTEEAADDGAETVEAEAPAEEAPEAAEPVQPVEEAEQAEEARPDPKQAHGPIPEKTFIGTEIPLPCGKILFDAETERTRIILNDSPTAETVQKIKEAGFFYSPRTKSYNKKLTFRAYRAAVKLAADLNAA